MHERQVLINIPLMTKTTRQSGLTSFLVPFNDVIWNRLYAYLKELYAGLSQEGSFKELETAI